MFIKKIDYKNMDFYGLIEKVEFEGLIRQARQGCVKNALDRLRNFDAMNEDFFKAAMPDDTPKPVIKKRTNKLLLMKRKKDLKRMLG